MPCDILNDKIERHLQQYLAPALFLLRGELTPSGVLLILSPKELVFVRYDSEKIKDTYSNNKIIYKDEFSSTAESQEIEDIVKADSRMLEALNGREIVKVIVIKNRLINVIAK